MRTRPEWLEPEAALAAWVPAEFVLARTDDLVVCIGSTPAAQLQLWPQVGLA